MDEHDTSAMVYMLSYTLATSVLQRYWRTGAREKLTRNVCPRTFSYLYVLLTFQRLAGEQSSSICWKARSMAWKELWNLLTLEHDDDEDKDPHRAQTNVASLPRQR